MDVKEKLNRGHEISELLIDIPPSVLPSKWHSKLVKFGNKEQRKHSQNAIFLKHPSALEHVDKTLNSTFNLDSSPSWWASLIRSYHHDSFFENTEALKQLSDFSLKFPDAVETLLYEAKYHVFDLNFKAARSIFQKIQLIDPWVLQYMDMYAFTLMELDELDTMNRVVNDLFALYPQCKEPYVAVALKFVAERDLSKINCLLDKANSLDASHFMTQFVRGRVFFVQKEFDKAFNLFYELYLMGNRIPLIFYNLIHASMAAKNGTQDILNLAHVALEVHPQNVPLLSIIGKYLASYGSVKDKKRAVILLKQSLDNNPQLTSIEALVSLYLSEKVYPSALEIINKYTSNLPAEFGHLQRAYFYMNIDDMNSAFSSINQALIANPNSKRALDLHNNLISRCG
ncbi:Anaphase-promoting complex subunit 7 [Coelomomyces lativittatus]|nr:Anaphase-promoting complex subunit 7 [Coelomomyces lativittatus]